MSNKTDRIICAKSYARHLNVLQKRKSNGMTPKQLRKIVLAGESFVVSKLKVGTMSNRIRAAHKYDSYEVHKTRWSLVSEH